MSKWTLGKVFHNLHTDVEGRLSAARTSFSHPGTTGDASENVWIDLLRTYLPKRYNVSKAHVVDALGKTSDQIDIVIFDRHYTPPIFDFSSQMIVPAESVYAVFEAKQELNQGVIEYARQKVKSVRRLSRTSLPIMSADGQLKAIDPRPILGGVLALDTRWNPPLGNALVKALEKSNPTEQLDIGCIASRGLFHLDGAGVLSRAETGKAATKFLLELIAKLQVLGTVPAIDTRAYSKWLDQ